MKKVLSRVAIGLLLLTITGIVLCFYLDKFTYAYGLILVLFFVFAGAGKIYGLKNDEYIYEKELMGINMTEQQNFDKW